LNKVNDIVQYSVNPVNGKKHLIPNQKDESNKIKDFLEVNHGKKVIVVQGLGFVGAVMSLICANALTEEYAVIGIDLANEMNYWKIDSINQGHFPIVADDDKIEELFHNTRIKKNLLATHDPFAYSVADIIIIDINLDVQKSSDQNNVLLNYDVDLSGFKKAITTVGENCKEDVLILVETTVPPGTCKQIVEPIISKTLKERGVAINKWALGHSYERVMPGPDYIDSIQNFYRVYSGINEESANRTESFLKTIIRTDQYPLSRLADTTATEMAKVLENSYRAMNISFMIEWTRFAEEAGVNLYEIVEAIRMRPTHKNIMFPGIGVGGYCLTKDPLMASWARQQMFGGEPLEDSENSVRKNDRMPLNAFNFLKHHEPELLNKTVLLLGVSYRQDVADTRSSPVESFYSMLQTEGAKIITHDPFVRYWEEKDLKVSNDLESVLKEDIDIIVVSTKHKMYSSDELFTDLICNINPVKFFDTVGALTENQLLRFREKHNVKILGRGDIR
jgi:nucleotide sugar dehydrogenase